MRPQSAKAKGRRLQQLVAKRIQETFNLPSSDVKSLPMGSPGADVWLSAAAMKEFPFGIECKNVEKLNVQEAFQQARDHCTNDRGVLEETPLLIHSKNRGEVLATLRFEDLLHIVKNGVK